MSTIIRDDLDNGIAVLTLNRPEARHALSRALVSDAAKVLAELHHDTSLRAVILTGAGDAAFCAGADLIERGRLSTDERSAHTAKILALVEQLAALPVPVIAAVRGFALAGGTELALACDLRVAGEDAVFGLPEVRIGIFPGAGGVARLPRLVGPAIAADLLYTGRRVKADEALRIGLVNRVVESDHVLPTAIEIAIEIAASAPLGVRALKAALRESDGLAIEHANRVIATHRLPLDHTRDYAEGLAAFAEKRPPKFTGK